MIGGYTENLVIRHTLVIKDVLFCCDHLRVYIRYMYTHLTSKFCGTLAVFVPILMYCIIQCYVCILMYCIIQ